MISADIFEGKDISDIFEDEEIQNLVWCIFKMNNEFSENIEEIVSKVDEKVESIVLTWEKLLENEGFRELSEKEQRLIWELIKIRENDSPKNQTKVAEQYNVTDAHLSQLKQKIEKLGL